MGKMWSFVRIVLFVMVFLFLKNINHETTKVATGIHVLAVSK